MQKKVIDVPHLKKEIDKSDERIVDMKKDIMIKEKPMQN